MPVVLLTPASRPLLFKKLLENSRRLWCCRHCHMDVLILVRLLEGCTKHNKAAAFFAGKCGRAVVCYSWGAPCVEKSHSSAEVWRASRGAVLARYSTRTATAAPQTCPSKALLTEISFWVVLIMCLRMGNEINKGVIRL